MYHIQTTLLNILSDMIHINARLQDLGDRASESDDRENDHYCNIIYDISGTLEPVITKALAELVNVRLDKDNHIYDLPDLKKTIESMTKALDQ